MNARVLVVDDIESNIRLLRDKLTHEYFSVITANSGAQALERAKRDRPDIILLDVMMPEMDGFETCRKLKEDPATRHIPVVMVTALYEREDRVRGLEVGADDFLIKPVNDLALLTRVRSLTRFKLVLDELLQREASGRAFGVIEGVDARDSGQNARILLVDDNPRQVQRLCHALEREHRPVSFHDTAQSGPVNQAILELIIVSLSMKMMDPLKFVATIRGQELSRHIPVLVVADDGDQRRAMRALELGASDIITRPVDLDELGARVRTLVRRKRYLASLRARLDHSFEAAVTDQLTGLHNRRYMINHLRPLLQRAAFGGAPVSILIGDVDHFKKINDAFGHDAGDEVLQEFARRLRIEFRPTDLVCRYGGEEFVVVMPETGIEKASEIAERVRRVIASVPFKIRKGQDNIDVTLSLGVAVSSVDDQNEETLIKRADEALYRAKSEGRNRVALALPDWLDVAAVEEQLLALDEAHSSGKPPPVIADNDAAIHETLSDAPQPTAPFAQIALEPRLQFNLKAS